MAEGGKTDLPIALRRKVDFVGKTNKRSKVCVFWAFQSRRGSAFRHEVKMTYSSMSGKRRIWFNGKMIHEKKKFKQKSAIPYRYRWEGGGYRLECLSLKNGQNYKINLIVDDIPFIKLPRRRTNISLDEIFNPRRMCRVDGSWGDSTAVSIGCQSEHLGKRLAGSKRKIQYFFVFLDSPQDEHVVEVMYSILSGKRQLKVDGRLIHKSQKLQMTLSFKHAFNELGHMFEMMVQEKSDMILTRLCIDGFDFRRLPLVSRDQLALAISNKKNKPKAGDDDAIDEEDIVGPSDDELEGEEDDDDDDDDEEEEESEEEEAAPKAAPSDLLADLFGAHPAPANSGGAFDPFAPAPAPAAAGGGGTGLEDLFGAQASIGSRKQSGHFVDSPTASNARNVMDPFAKIAHTRGGAAQPPQAPQAAFDPFGDSFGSGQAQQQSRNQSIAQSSLFGATTQYTNQPQQKQQPPADPFAGF